MHNKDKHFRLKNGFTLIELLVSLAVFSIMSVMAYGGLSQIIDNSKHSKTELKRLQSVQRAVLIISRDFTQISRRDIRDEYGNNQPFLNANKQQDNLIEFTRGGRRNPAKLKRSSFVRVAYQFEDEKLIRLFWPQLDRAPSTTAYKNTLLDEVENIEFRYKNDRNEWQNQWPPLGGIASRLIAIELVLELKDWGKITRLYQVDL